MKSGTSLTDIGQKTRVLVVDDEPEIQEVVAALLADEGYAVRCAGDGLEALAAVERDDYDLVISDVTMPRLDGLALVRELRFRGYRLPVVLMSATPPAADLTGLTFVAKPFESRRLLGVVASTARASRLRHGNVRDIRRSHC